MAIIINGKELANKVKTELIKDVILLNNKGIKPGLAVVLVGNDPASSIYVRNKTKACQDVGITHFDHILPSTITQQELLDLLHSLNKNPFVDGILVQLPLPSSINSEVILNAINPSKDVDGFHPVNLGHLVTGDSLFVPCTPLGIMRMLHYVETPLKGAEAVVVGRSTIVGKPTALLLLAEHCTVTICHSRTYDLASVVSRADILVAAVGKSELIKGEWIKKGATVIDVGMNRNNTKLLGDVEFSTALERARAISPVPGGVGPMTIAMLLSNTIMSAKRRSNI